MKINKLALSLLVGIGTGCTTVPPAPRVSMSDLPNCFDTNYDEKLDLFRIKNDVGNSVNQQCLLTVGPRRDAATASRLRAGSYRVYLSNGGGGGAGGGSGGGGAGGAGAKEVQATVNLTEGVYMLTIGAGGSGGSACPEARLGGGPGWHGGAPGWLGSPSNMIRVATGKLVIGTPGADRYVRPTQSQNEQMAGKMDAHGGSGPGQTSGGHGGLPETNVRPEVEAAPGASKLASGRSGVGGAPGGDYSEDDQRAGEGGGGGASRLGSGGAGSGETPGGKDTAPQRGLLGSGGGGGEGGSSLCDPGARGGHGYISFRPI